MQFNVKQPSKKFNPVTVELTFETQEELNWFYWVSNSSTEDVKKNNHVQLEESDYTDAQMSLFNFAGELHQLCSV